MYVGKSPKGLCLHNLETTEQRRTTRGAPPEARQIRQTSPMKYDELLMRSVAQFLSGERSIFAWRRVATPLEVSSSGAWACLFRRNPPFAVVFRTSNFPEKFPKKAHVSSGLECA